MGWRFRKRIKILPGVRINLSKSGISTTVGVRGASVTFGPNGTYVNTGIPGTGIYSRERISGPSMSTGTNYIINTSNSSVESNLFNYRYFLVSEQGIRIPVFKTNYYIAYLIALLTPILGLFLFMYGWWMIACCLLTALIHLVCWMVLYDKVDYSSKTASFAFQWIKDVHDKKVKHILRGHQVRMAISGIIAFFCLYPLFAMFSEFMSLFVSWPRIYEGGVIVSIITIITVFLWIAASCQEYAMLKKLKTIIIPFNERADRNRDVDICLAFNDIRIGESVAKHDVADWQLTDEYENYKSYSVQKTLIVDGVNYDCDCIINSINDSIGSLEVIIEKNISKDLYPLFVTKYGVPNGKEIKDFESPFSKAWNYNNCQVAFQYGLFGKEVDTKTSLFEQIRITYIDRKCNTQIEALSEERKQKELIEQLHKAEIEKIEKTSNEEVERLRKIEQREKESQQI